MSSPLEKARKDPESTKARILAVARRLFGQYGFHGATMRLIAGEVGMDISTLYYHWGEKEDLYQAVILDITEDLRAKLAEVEKTIHGKPLAERMAIALDAITGWLFEHPEISNLILLRYFSKTRAEMTWDREVPTFVSDIARSMGLAGPDRTVDTDAKLKVMGMMMAIYNFISGEEFFRSMLDLERADYIRRAKETLRFMLIPAFVTGEGSSGRKGRAG